MLDHIHQKSLRIATGAFRTSPMENLHVEADEDSLYLRRKRLSALYAIKRVACLTTLLLIEFLTRNIQMQLLLSHQQFQLLESE